MEDNGELHKIVVLFSKWLTNKRSPCAAYHVLVDCHLIDMDMHPGVYTMGEEDNWQRMMDKCMLKMVGLEAKKSCGMEKIYREV